MEIKIKSPDELNRLLRALAMEIVDANIYHQLFRELVDSIKDYPTEFRQSNTFWNFTLDALRDAAMIRLCRVFDQETTSLNLFNLLETIKANIHFFEENHFRERLKDNAFVKSLAKDNRMPDKTQLDNDIWFVSKDNPLVKKLTIWRNNIIAHRSAKISLGKKEILINNPFGEKELSTLLGECYRILNRYSSLFRALTYSRKVIGHDDYKSLLNLIKLGLQKRREDNKKEVQGLNRKWAEHGNQPDRE